MFQKNQFVFVAMDQCDQSAEYNKPPFFTLKKWMLSAFIVINILALIHYSMFVVQITDNALHRVVDMKPEHYENTTVCAGGWVFLEQSFVMEEAILEWTQKK